MAKHERIEEERKTFLNYVVSGNISNIIHKAAFILIIFLQPGFLYRVGLAKLENLRR
jgi:hypothetical protein